MRAFAYFGIVKWHMWVLSQGFFFAKDYHYERK